MLYFQVKPKKAKKKKKKVTKISEGEFAVKIE
jgi:hypothetical protein